MNLPVHIPFCFYNRDLIKHRDSAPAAVTEADQAQKQGKTPRSSEAGEGVVVEGTGQLAAHSAHTTPALPSRSWARTLTVGKPGMLKSLQMALLVSSAQSRAARFRAGLQSERNRKPIRYGRGAGTSACSPAPGRTPPTTVPKAPAPGALTRKVIPSSGRLSEIAWSAGTQPALRAQHRRGSPGRASVFLQYSAVGQGHGGRGG